MTSRIKEKTTIELVLELGLKYVGRDGAHLTGIPAQHLSPAVVLTLTKEQINECLDSGLYQLAQREVKNHE
jgi:hypothetical protein